MQSINVTFREGKNFEKQAGLQQEIVGWPSKADPEQGEIMARE
jgi:hypothetical protein